MTRAGAVSAAVRRRLERVAVACLAVGSVRQAGLWAIRHRYVRRWPTLAGRVIDRVLILQQPDLEQRRATGADLVELFFDLCALARIDLFVEAGAKEATASQRAVKQRGIERVVAFEANPYTFDRYSPDVEHTDVEYQHLALGERDEPVTLLVRRRGDGSPIADGQGSLLRRPGYAPGYEHVTVDGVSLDSFFADHRCEHIAMWVDVEGVVDRVFGGATELLSACDVVLVEVESRRLWDGQIWLDTDVAAAMVEAGLRPIARDAQSRFQYNVLFVRETALDDPAIAGRIRRWRTGSGT